MRPSVRERTSRVNPECVCIPVLNYRRADGDLSSSVLTALRTRISVLRERLKPSLTHVENALTKDDTLGFLPPCMSSYQLAVAVSSYRSVTVEWVSLTFITAEN